MYYTSGDGQDLSPYVPEQDLLLPPSLREWLPENRLAFFVSDLIDQLDLSAITWAYQDEERGYPPYHPVMLTKVLTFSIALETGLSAVKSKGLLAQFISSLVRLVGEARVSTPLACVLGSR